MSILTDIFDEISKTGRYDDSSNLVVELLSSLSDEMGDLWDLEADRWLELVDNGVSESDAFIAIDREFEELEKHARERLKAID